MRCGRCTGSRLAQLGQDRVDDHRRALQHPSAASRRRSDSVAPRPASVASAVLACRVCSTTRTRRSGSRACSGWPTSRAPGAADDARAAERRLRDAGRRPLASGEPSGIAGCRTPDRRRRGAARRPSSRRSPPSGLDGPRAATTASVVTARSPSTTPAAARRTRSARSWRGSEEAEPKVRDAVIAGFAKGWPKDKPPTLDDAGQKAIAALLPKLSAGSRGQMLGLASRWGVKGLDAFVAAAGEGPPRVGLRREGDRGRPHRRRPAAHRPPQERPAGRARRDRPGHGEDPARPRERPDRRRGDQRRARGRDGPGGRDGADDPGGPAGERPGAARQDGLDERAGRRDRGGQGADVAPDALAVAGAGGPSGQSDRRAGQGAARQGGRPARPGSREGHPGAGADRPEGGRRLARQGGLQEGMRQVPHALRRGGQGRPGPHRHGGAPEERAARPHPRPEPIGRGELPPVHRRHHATAAS